MRAIRKLRRKPHVLALLLLAAVILSECLGGGALGALDWKGTRLVGQADLGTTRANFWLAGGILPVAEFQNEETLPILVRSEIGTDQEH